MTTNSSFRKILALAVSLLCMPCTGAAALECVQHGHVSFYYPKGEEKIITRLKNETDKILKLLEQKGLPVTLPVHVILDERLDEPEVDVRMIPHREIHIPLRAPGVLEDGYLEKDPWLYFYFKGLCIQGIYAKRSGLPSLAHSFFGEIVSPNAILPPWLTEGVCRILYCSHTGSPLSDPFSLAIFRTSIPQDLSRVSNHPGNWPGYYAYRIYGIPFISWVDSSYGWDKILAFLTVHGKGILPIEIDLKAEKVFGKTWAEIWEDFIRENPVYNINSSGMMIEGYWPDPFIYWNASGVFPGPKSIQRRGRYGYISGDKTLWVSEYRDGISRIAGHRAGITRYPEGPHLWDPAPGGIAVTRSGSRPRIVLFDFEEKKPVTRIVNTRFIDAPAGALELSGPVMDRAGRIAVSVNTGGNWDIWVHDVCWTRITSSPSIELDPWWDGESLVFSSNISGKFEIHDACMVQVTRSVSGALLPRDGTYLRLKSSGWSMERLPDIPHLSGDSPAASIPHDSSNTKAAHIPGQDPAQDPVSSDRDPSGPSPFARQDERGMTNYASPDVHTDNDQDLNVRPYSAWPSIYPDFIAPDFYAGPSDTQAGLVTWGRDVSGQYAVRTGVRYSLELDYISLQASTQVRDFGLSYVRYPLSYDPENSSSTEESRQEIGLSFRPLSASWLSFSLNRRTFEPLDGPGFKDQESWAEITLSKQYSSLTPSVSAEAFSGGMKSVFGSLRFVYGSDITLSSLVQAGKSWGETSPGHGTFRVGGNTGEGYFTRRPSRLFSLRGFDPNILESSQAIVTSFEVYCPLADLQMGHETLPLFLHRLSLGTFVDAGVCSDKIARDQIMAGGGFELITSMEIAWGNLSAFRLGIAWPMSQPDYLNEKGPVLILQIGRPL